LRFLKKIGCDDGSGNCGSGGRGRSKSVLKEREKVGCGLKKPIGLLGRVGVEDEIKVEIVKKILLF